MISRRSFLKLSGLAAVSLGGGLTVGKFVSNNSTNKNLILCGFVPGDKESIITLLDSFIDSTLRNTPFELSVKGDHYLASVIKSRILSNGNNIISGNKVIVNISKLNSPLPADILLKESNSNIYSPESDFSQRFIDIRNSFSGQDGVYLLQAEIKENSLFDLFRSNNKVAVIENEKGIAEKISLDRKTVTYSVNGSLGKVVFNIGDGFAHVHSSSCKHQLCKQSGRAISNRDFIACAPNKIILRIEQA
ncbi:MAG: NusG domain II-containing protein [Ignavibacteria bacterium]|nr:NusG domain II-containing protein [Ignavibacteria bacterium]